MWSHHHRLRSRNAGVRIAHLGPGDGAALDDHFGLGPEHGGLPQNEIGKLRGFDRAHEVGHAVGHIGVDGVLGNIPQDAFVVSKLVLFLEPPKFLFLRCTGNHVIHQLPIL